MGFGVRQQMEREGRGADDSLGFERRGVQCGWEGQGERSGVEVEMLELREGEEYLKKGRGVWRGK